MLTVGRRRMRERNVDKRRFYARSYLVDSIHCVTKENDKIELEKMILFKWIELFSPFFPHERLPKTQSHWNRKLCMTSFQLRLQRERVDHATQLDFGDSLRFVGPPEIYSLDIHGQGEGNKVAGLHGWMMPQGLNDTRIISDYNPNIQNILPKR